MSDTKTTGVKIDSSGSLFFRLRYLMLDSLAFDPSIHLAILFLTGTAYLGYGLDSDFHSLGLVQSYLLGFDKGYSPLEKCFILFGIYSLSLSIFYTLLVFTKVTLRWGRIETALKKAGIQNADKERPVVAYIDKKNPPSFIHLKGNGIGPEEIQAKKTRIEGMLARTISNVEFYGEKMWVRINFAKEKLDESLKFEDIKGKLKKPGSFFLGSTDKGLLTDNLENHTHIAICGTSGGGKSNFLNQFLLGLYRSSPSFDFVLIDLKEGLELTGYEDLKRCAVYSDVNGALRALTKVENEMKERFKTLKAKKLRKFSEKDLGKSRMVVAIDETAELFRSDSGNKDKELVKQKCKELVRTISNQARAAGIHLVLATQRIYKDTIDTATQANMGATLAFRLPDTTSSVLAIGTTEACSIPVNPGAGLWKHGFKTVMIQVPFISDQVFNEEIELLKNL